MFLAWLFFCITDYFERVMIISNKMRSNGEDMSYKKIVEKIRVPELNLSKEAKSSCLSLPVEGFVCCRRATWRNTRPTCVQVTSIRDVGHGSRSQVAGWAAIWASGSQIAGHRLQTRLRSRVGSWCDLDRGVVGGSVCSYSGSWLQARVVGCCMCESSCLGWLLGHSEWLVSGLRVESNLGSQVEEID